jgi:endonuclease YncB( thermonuclease family)
MTGSNFIIITIFLSYVLESILAFGVYSSDVGAPQSSHFMGFHLANPSSIQSSLILSALNDNEMKASWSNAIKELTFETDQVVRIIDANTIKLKKKGLVSLVAINTPSGYKDDFRFPQCMSKSPASKIKQLLPRDTEVLVRITDEGTARPRALIIIKNTGKVVNFELVRSGFAKPVKDGRKMNMILPEFYEGLLRAQEQAKNDGLGMFQRCDSSEEAPEDQFEELDATVEIRYGIDGGTQMFKLKDDRSNQIPSDPGDNRKVSRNSILLLYNIIFLSLKIVTNIFVKKHLSQCSDFHTYEEALSYYEKYYPYYGDVSKLDRNGDGIPCSGLPHDKNGEKFRLKKACQ